MLRRFYNILLFAAALCAANIAASAQMTDQQVVDYAKAQVAAGKSKQSIGAELLSKGVTKEQLERIRSSYENTSGAPGIGASTITTISDRSRNSAAKTAAGVNETPVVEVTTVNAGGNDIGNIGTGVFGQDVFTSKLLTFEPNQNMATPANYRLGPGDEVFIDIWGASEDNIVATISPEGSIMVSQIGPVYLNGLTVSEANRKLSKLFAKKYAGITDAETHVSLTLGDVRSIMINVMGEVNVPGTYTISPFSSVFTALYNAGGVSDLGTLRNVQVIRNGKVVSKIDLYDFIFNGKLTHDIRLQENDIIMVPVQGEIVNISGNVKRPMRYEMLPNESVSKLIEYAGGFMGNAYSEMVTVARHDNVDNTMINLYSDDFDSFNLNDGDNVVVGQINGRFENRVTLEGSVLRPGSYAIGTGIETVGQLIRHAGEGLLDDAFTNRALIYRLDDNLRLQMIAFDVNDILSGLAEDIPLQKDDRIVISSINDIERVGSVAINGQVNNPGIYPFAQNTTIEDLIVMAGGLRQGASLVRADLSRRVTDPYSTHPVDTIAEIYSFNIKDGLVIDGQKDFYLQPYDIVEIRRSPGYVAQKNVIVEGEVVFGGLYTLETRGERLSSVIRRCGGLTPAAYAKGAMLLRRMTDEEAYAREQALRLAMRNQNGDDSISVKDLILSNTYAVGINLQEALENPGSYADIVLQDGDRLTVPENINTVKISGDVMFPTVTTYVPGKKWKKYVELAGGFGERARKSRAFVIYMNGMVAKLKGNTPIEPGCQIIVPSKPESKGTDWSQILAITSSFTSLSTLAATLYSIFK